jgi:catechol 2,3-dioxygenase-like lactoylglutathione lyase family enzyme
MFDHVLIRVTDPAASERFYDTVLAATGIEKTGAAGEFGEGCAEFAQWGEFLIAAADEQNPPTTGLHIGFGAWSRDAVQSFWEAGIAAGFRSDGDPGLRPVYGDDYFGAFLRDPDGNSAEAVNNEQPRSHGGIDHLWIRVADVAAAKRFYETIAPYAGIRLGDDQPDRAQFLGADGSCSFVSGDTRTEHVHLAFPTTSDDTVHAFHRAATEAGYRDNGAPGERPVYRPGYYGAFVLDPDGNNVEVVNHRRG